MKQIKSRSLTNPAHVRSVVGERAWKRISASGVAWGLQGFENNSHTMMEKWEQHLQTWSKELLEERNAILGKFRLKLGNTLDRQTIPVRGVMVRKHIGTEGHEREAYTIAYMKDYAKFVGHTKYHMNESDDNWLKYFPAILAELDWLASKAFWSHLAKLDKPTSRQDSVLSKEGFVLRRIRSVPRIVRKLVKMVGVRDSELNEGHCRGDDTNRQLLPLHIDTWECPSGTPVEMRASVVLGKGEVRNDPDAQWSHGFAHMQVSCEPHLSNITAWTSSGEADTNRLSNPNRWVDIDLRLDITQPVGRTFARKFAKLVNEYRSKEEA